MAGSFYAGVIDNLPQPVLLSLMAALGALAFCAVVFYFRFRRPSLRQAAGGRIALTAGDRFAQSDRFTGFVDETSGASIVLMELPLAAFYRLQKSGNAAETFAAQGIANASPQTLPARRGDYIYFHGEQTTALVDYIKHILVFSEGGIAAMVTVNVPRAALTSGLITGAEIESILSSARVEPVALEGPRLFALEYLGAFEEDPTLSGSAKGYRIRRPSGAELSKGLQPLFLIAPSLTAARVRDLKGLAEQIFHEIEQVRDKTIEAVETIEIGSCPAVEVTGQGLDAFTRERAMLYQAVVEAPHGGYFRLLGLAPLPEASMFVHEFRKIARSFRPAL